MKESREEIADELKLDELKTGRMQRMIFKDIDCSFCMCQ